MKKVALSILLVSLLVPMTLSAQKTKTDETKNGTGDVQNDHSKTENQYATRANGLVPQSVPVQSGARDVNHVRRDSENNGVTTWDFEDASQFSEWTAIDSDGDTFNWQYFNNNGSNYGQMITHSGYGLVASASYDYKTSSPLTPDNWFISPEVTLNGRITLWACGQDPNNPNEVFGVYVYVGQPNSTDDFVLEDFVQVGADVITTDEMKQYEFNLSKFNGQTGHFAIRHYHVSDVFYLNIDDVTIDSNYTPTIIALDLLNDDTAETIKNSDKLTETIYKEVDVTLSGRTFYKDGKWNTLCLPFSLSSFSGTPLDGASVMTLSSAEFENNTLTLNFDNVTSIEAGKPYIVQWAQGADIEDPEFKNVTISNTSPESVGTDGVALFRGFYSALSITESTPKMLYLGANNTLYYPNAAMTIGSCRAVFDLQGDLVCSQPTDDEPSGINTFALNLGGEETGIIPIENGRLIIETGADEWFMLDGRKLSGKPTAKGIYINKGRKIVIK